MTDTFDLLAELVDLADLSTHGMDEWTFDRSVAVYDDDVADIDDYFGGTIHIYG